MVGRKLLWRIRQLHKNLYLIVRIDWRWWLSPYVSRILFEISFLMIINETICWYVIIKQKKTGNDYRLNLIKKIFFYRIKNLYESGTNILFNEFIVIMFMTLYYKERIITISLDLYNRFAIFPPFRSTWYMFDQHETCIHSGANHHHYYMCVLYTSIFLYSFRLKLYIVLCFSIERTREIDYSPILTIFKQYLTKKKMSNFESIYEVELTSYYSMMVMMIGRRRRTKIPIKFILDGMQ